MPIGVGSIVVEVAKRLQKRSCQLFNVCACELLVPHRLSLAQEGGQSYQMVERKMSGTSSSRVQHV